VNEFLLPPHWAAQEVSEKILKILWPGAQRAAVSRNGDGYR